MSTLPLLGRVSNLGRLPIHGRPDYWTTLGRIQSNMVLDFTSATISDTLAARGFTFTRSGATATRVNSSGVLETVAANTLRIDHDPTTLACLGGLFEEASTNAIRNSIATGAVTGSPGTVPTNWIFADAGLTRTVTVVGSENGFPCVDIRWAGTATDSLIQVKFDADTQVAALPSQAWTCSQYLKLAAGSLANVTKIGPGVIFRASGGTFIWLDFASTTPTSAALRTQRFLYTATAPAMTEYAQGMFRATVTVGAAIDFTLRIGAPQLEQKAFATSYIPTAGAAVTRLSDALMTTALAAMGYSATAGTVVVRSRALGFSAGSSPAPYLFGVGSLSSNELSVYFDGSARKTVGEARSGGAVQMSMSAAEVIAAGASYISALAWAENDAALVVNGGTPVTDTSIVLPVGIDRVSIGGRQARGQTGVGSQIISRIEYYPRRLSNAELQTLTT